MSKVLLIRFSNKTFDHTKNVRRMEIFTSMTPFYNDFQITAADSILWCFLVNCCWGKIKLYCLRSFGHVTTAKNYTCKTNLGDTESTDGENSRLLRSSNCMSLIDPAHKHTKLKRITCKTWPIAILIIQCHFIIYIHVKFIGLNTKT